MSFASSCGGILTEEARFSPPTRVGESQVLGLARLWLGEGVDGEEESETCRLVGDTVNCLFSAGLRLATVRSLLRALPNQEAPELVDEADERVSQALEEIDMAIQGLRSIVWELDG